MAYSCFDNLILFRGACDGTVRSDSVYIDDIPGISLRKGAKIADDDLTGAALLNRIINTAIEITVDDFTTELSSEINFSQVLDAAHVGRIPSAYDNSHTGMFGIEIEKLNDDPFQALQIDRVTFYSNEARTAKFHYTDDCGTQECEINLVCGANDIEIDKCVQGCKAYISVDWDGRGVASEYGCKSNCSCIVDHCTKCSTNCFNVRGYYQDDLGQKDYTSELLGFTVNASCVCNDEQLVCRYRKQLKRAAWYQAGIQFFLHQKNSTNTGSLFVNNSAEVLESNLIDLRGGTNKFSGLSTKGLYHKALAKAVKGVLPSIKNQNTACLNCTGVNKIKIVKNMP